MILTEFLLARIAEKERIGRLVHRSSVGSDRKSTILAECEAARRIVALHPPVPDEIDVLFCATCCDRESPYGVGWPCQTIAALALPYADHPDYRQEWKP